MSYNVAYVGTRAAGGFEGIVTWTSYASKEAFEASKLEWTDECKAKSRVVEEGISVERCVELVKQTPAACYIASAVESATGSDGEVDTNHLTHELIKAAFSINLE